MAKDPAFLFYSSDFVTGTQFFTDEQTGKYIRLLCAQHLHGHLREKDMLNICKTYDEDIFEKFTIDDDGLYYNEVLETHINKRKDYAESRRNNRLKKNSSTKQTKSQSIKPKKDMNNISSSYEQHMENVNVNVNSNKKENKKGKDLEKKVAEFKEEVFEFSQDYGEDLCNAFFNYWSELNASKTKMLWQTKPTFQIKNRLTTWVNNNSKNFTQSSGLKPDLNKTKLQSAEERHNDLLNNYEDG